ncbi:MAG: hypothetical protein R3252_09530, partial [Robiginitalea sp.]|nr:hypothetical protein [Robiginitalea sp.]
MTRFLLLFCLLAAGFLRAQINPDPPSLQDADGSAQLFSNTPGAPVNIDQVSRSVESYWEGRDPFKKGSGYKPFKRWEYYWKHLADTRGNLPSSEKILNSWKNKQDLTARTPNPTANWNSVGPSNVGVYSGRLPGTGRLNAVAVDPNNQNIWYAGAPAGGIWKSTNAGQSWTNLFDDFLQIGVSGIAIDPEDSNTIYITTGDDDAADSYSIGVYKSTDGGQTWGPTGLTTSGVNTLMNEIVIDPSNSSVLWVGTSAGLYKSTDAGANWELMQSGYISDFKLKPGDPNTVYAVANRHIGGAGNATTYYKSTN